MYYSNDEIAELLVSIYEYEYKEVSEYWAAIARWVNRYALCEEEKDHFGIFEAIKLLIEEKEK